MSPDDELNAAERLHVGLLCGFFVEWASMLGAPAWVREAITSSLEDGWLRGKVAQALAEARERGRREGERSTPLVDVGEPSGDSGALRPTLPTEPPGVGVDYSDPPTRKVVHSQTPTRRGFPRVADD